MPTMISQDRASASAPAVEPPEGDVTMPAFRAEVTSDEFWAAVEAGRSGDTLAEKLQVSAAYRRQRAERAAAELRR